MPRTRPDLWPAPLAVALVAALAAPLATCSDDGGDPEPDDGGSDADADADADTDTDTDADTDTGEDDTPPELPAACSISVLHQPVSGDGDGRWPAIVRGGDHALITWAYDEQEGEAEDWDVQVASFDLEAAPIVGEAAEPINPSALSEKPAMAHRDGVFGVVWLDARWDPACDTADLDACRRELAFLELDPTGQPVDSAEPVQITLDEDVNGRPSIAATSSGYLVAWNDTAGSSGTAQVVAVGADGTPGAVHLLGEQGAAAPMRRVAVAALGEQAIVAWLGIDQTNIYTQEIGPDGAPLGEPRELGDMTPCLRPRLAAGDDRILLTWTKRPVEDYDVYSIALDGSGAPIGDEQRITWTDRDVLYATPVWDGERFAVAWLGDRADGADECAVDSCNDQVFITALDAAGAPRARAVRVSDNPNDSSVADITWHPGGYTAVFEVRRNMRQQVFYGTILCDD